MKKQIQLDIKELLFNLWEEIEASTDIRMAVNTIQGHYISATLDCRYVPNVLLSFFHPLDVDLFVVGVREKTLVLEYGVVTPSLLHDRLVSDHIKNNTTHRELEILTEEKRVLMHLDGFKKMKKLLSVAQPVDVKLDNDTMMLNMILT